MVSSPLVFIGPASYSEIFLVNCFCMLLIIDRKPIVVEGRPATVILKLGMEGD